MADISNIGMVTYYNSLAMYRQQQQQNGTQQPQQHTQAQQAVAVAAAAAAQQHPVAGIAGTDGSQQYYYSYSPHTHPHAAHQGPGSQQYLDHAEVLAGWAPHPHAHHYSHHIQYQHHQATYQQHHQQHQTQPMISGMAAGWSGDEGHHNGTGTSEPSPPITVSGSEISSPGTSSTPPAHNNGANLTGVNGPAMSTRPAQIRSPYEWMRKPSYQSQPNPACGIAAPATTSVSALHELGTIDALGKTRTKDKYRVVYTDHQRLELEKEFHYSRYITIRRKAELASNLALSERQVKIWFQNRRAKERKQVKKREELEQKDIKPTEGLAAGGMATLQAALGGMGSMLGGLMHNGPSPPLNLGPSPHPLALGHPPPPPPPPSLHSLPSHQHSPHQHSHQHTHNPHSVLGL